MVESGVMERVNPEAVAEDLDSYVLRAPTWTVADRGFAVLIDGPEPPAIMRFACRLRLDSDPEVDVAGIRAWFRDRGRHAFTWKLGQHSTPTDLEARLRAHGAHEDEAEPEHTAMVLDAEPPPVDGVEVHTVESYEDYVRSAEIMFVGFAGSFTASEVAAMRAALPQRFDGYQGQTSARRYLAFANGIAVAMATAIETSALVVALYGGATLPEARGRGAYRALVHARWLDAVRSGSTALVTQASGMSRPVLERLGFRAVGPVLELIDTTRV